MFGRRKHRTVPGLNTSSTADISFMMLVFFLVTTSMEVDWGMARQLPAYNKDKTEFKDVDRTKVLTLHLCKEGRVLLDEGEEFVLPLPKEREQVLRRKIKDFVVVKGNQHIIELVTDGDASYDSYFQLQDVIVRSYREIHNAVSMQRNGKPYSECSEEERQSILAKYPQRVQEIQ